MYCKLFIRLILFSLFTLGSISCNKNPLIGDIVEDGGLREQLYAKFKAYRLSRNGPEWETGIFVDAIVSIKDVKTSNVNYLIARNQKINRLD